MTVQGKATEPRNYVVSMSGVDMGHLYDRRTAKILAAMWRRTARERGWNVTFRAVKVTP